jgi:hypothetical protein
MAGWAADANRSKQSIFTQPGPLAEVGSRVNIDDMTTKAHQFLPLVYRRSRASGPSLLTRFEANVHAAADFIAP